MLFIRTTASLAAAILALGGTALAQIGPTPTAVPQPMGKIYTISFTSQNGSGETGTATLQAKGNGTVVIVSLNGAPAFAQPAHIHRGTCANLDKAVAFPLNPVVGGKSTTTVDYPVGYLVRAGQPFAINVHKSATEAGTYVACADINPQNARHTMAM